MEILILLARYFFSSIVFFLVLNLTSASMALEVKSSGKNPNQSKLNKEKVWEQAKQTLDKFPRWRRIKKYRIEMIQSDKIWVVAKTQDSDVKGFQEELSIAGVGMTTASQGLAFDVLTNFKNWTKISDYIKAANYDERAKRLFLHLEAYGHHARMFMDVKQSAGLDHKDLYLHVVKGSFLGMIAGFRVVKDAKSRKSEILMTAVHPFEKLPLPRFFIEFGLEVVFQKIGEKLRSQMQTPSLQMKNGKKRSGLKGGGSEKGIANMSDKEGSNNEDRRKHPRINIQDEFKKAKALKGASLKIEGQGEELKIFDMSVTGMACEGNGANRGDQVKAHINLGEEDPQDLELEVMWSSGEVMGMRIVKCEANVRLSISDFLEDRLVGQHMIQVSPKYFADHVDFHAWFHGPNNTNVFLWKGKGGEGADYEKVMVAFDGQSMIFEDGEFQAGGEGLSWDEQATYSAETLPAKATQDDLPVILQKDSPLVQRSIEVLSQLKENQNSIEKLLKRMEQV